MSAKKKTVPRRAARGGAAPSRARAAAGRRRPVEPRPKPLTEDQAEALVKQERIVNAEALHIAAAEEPGVASDLTLGAARRFWLPVLGVLLGLVAGVQVYGYLTGWGDVERVVQRRIRAAQRLTLAQRYDAALGQYKKVLAMEVSNEHHRQAMIAMADLLREKHDWNRAVEVYQQLLDQNPDDVLAAWAGLQIADIQLESGKLTQARQNFGEVSRRFPDTDWAAEALLGLGKVLEQEGQYAEAIIHYRRVVARYGGGFLAAEALVRIGQCYELTGNETAARAAYQEVIDTYPASTWDKAKARMRRLDQGRGAEGVRRWGGEP